METLNIVLPYILPMAAIFMTWLVVKDNYRQELYKERLQAYKLIHDTIGQIYFYGLLAVKKPDEYEDSWSTSKYNLSVDVFQNELVVSSKIAKTAILFSKRDLSYIKNNTKQYGDEMREIFNQMRNELAFRLLRSADSPILHLSPKSLRPRHSIHPPTLSKHPERFPVSGNSTKSWHVLSRDPVPILRLCRPTIYGSFGNLMTKKMAHFTSNLMPGKGTLFNSSDKEQPEWTCNIKLSLW